MRGACHSRFTSAARRAPRTSYTGGPIPSRPTHLRAQLSPEQQKTRWARRLVIERHAHGLPPLLSELRDRGRRIVLPHLGELILVIVLRRATSGAKIGLSVANASSIVISTRQLSMIPFDSMLSFSLQYPRIPVSMPAKITPGDSRSRQFANDVPPKCLRELEVLDRGKVANSPCRLTPKLAPAKELG